LQGKACAKCRNNKNEENFLKKSKLIHGSKYDYSKVKYVNSNEKICIICHEKDKNKTEHEIMLERKLPRIYDCGCLVYEMKFNKL
jgi:hypothetical protein